MKTSVRFHTFNDPATGTGWWLRSVHTGDHHERWLARFRGNDRFVLREEGSLDLATVDHRVRMVPSTLRILGVRSQYECALVERPAERVTIAGQPFDLPAARACVGHVERSGTPQGWAWAHAHSFPGSDLWLEALHGRGMTSLFARHGRTSFRMNTLVALARNRTVRPPSSEGWAFSATTHHRELLGEVRCTPDLLVGVTYQAADGERIYCYNTEIASVRLTLRTRATIGFRWREETFSCDARAHYEIATREPLPGLPLHIR